MRVARGVVVSAQEGRFLLADGSGRMRLLMLAPGAGVEAQDLPDLVRSRTPVTVQWMPASGRKAGIAKRLARA